MIKLPYLEIIRVSGVDAGQFLHNQLSADVLALSTQDSTFACYCEPKGRVLALMLVHRVNEDYFVIMSSELTTAVTERLKIYRMRAKVEIQILSEYTVAGLDADGTPESLLTAQRIRIPGSNKWLLVITDGITAVTDVSLQEAWKYSELQMGISWLGTETSAQFLPQMLGFEKLGAVNYRKGCYPGQEIVARTHYLGKVKRHPRLLDCRLSSCPRPMDRIDILADGQAHESVVADCVQRQDGMIRLLAITRMEPEEPANKIQYEGETVNLTKPS